MENKIPRVGVGGPVGSGKTALIEAVVPVLVKNGYDPIILTNDIVTKEDAEHVKRTLQDVISTDRVLGVETGGCPHTAVREDPSMNLIAVEEMEKKFPDSHILFVETGGDNLTLTFNSALVDYYIYVIDVAAGEKIPRKNGPAITQSDLLIINKIDLASFVNADLKIMERDTKLMRKDKPFIFTNCHTKEGIDAVYQLIKKEVLFED
ncbi:MAG: urease accessory protein UreG [Candidatus Scalindua sp.]|jgi:urease accessory protein|nr:urease accessory protein UreG [Prochlorococcaceae cyanobacterium ETNP2_MAG_10]MDV5120951.1 urease accessory protein UreG [Candidatus Scalindua sp.]|tara:strand:- start:3635 stop:4255 length:621 start_codon:yes stop_codon:yes gene_type:complete